MKLVIVESPTKARKLKTYLGSGYQVEASVGHVRDLPKKTLGIDLENNFEPVYEVSTDKKKVVSQLKALSAQADTVYLAMDPDREGEAIAWHVQTLLQEGKAKSKTPVTTPNFVRATFHEITKQAVLEAINHPSELNLALVDAQQARRVLDRLVGYEVSPVLWKKVRRGLSAGRVQSVALRLIAEREREIVAFKSEEYWEVSVGLNTQDLTPQPTVFVDGKPQSPLPTGTLVAALEKVGAKKFEAHTQTEVNPIVTDLNQSNYTVTAVERKERQRQSLAPFTTSTLQQAAANRYGFSAKQTMSLAQNLYEEGLITYHRTDSVNLATSAIEMARQFIQAEFGAEFLPDQPRYFAQKSKNAQEAHEAVRVTDVNVAAAQLTAHAQLTDRHVKLYDLIWRRFLASQMTAARYDQTALTITAKPLQTSALKVADYTLKANGSIQKFAGWTTLFDQTEDQILPTVEEAQQLYFAGLQPDQKFTQPPPRYNDASLIKELEKRGIGRPSTYASIISVIVDRGYVERTDKKFFATPIGLTVNDFLVENFPEFMDYDFTAEMEEDLDRIARGEKQWRVIVANFYGPLSKKIASVVKDAARAQVPVEATGEPCPTCGATDHGEIVIRTGRFGKFKSCSRYPECKFTENIVQKLPDRKCPLCDQGEILVKKTRWGKPFFGCSRYPDCDWASWQAPAVDLKVTPAEWAVAKAERAERMAKRAESRGGTAYAAKTKPAAKAKAKPKAAVKPKAKAAAKPKPASKAKVSS
jgi:DNA topoisomerase-1